MGDAVIKRAITSIAHRIDSNGFFIEPVVVYEGETITPDLIMSPWVDGLYQPKWDGSAWVEGKAVADVLAQKKADKVAYIKAMANEDILAIAPYYKQINLTRQLIETGTKDPLLDQIDSIRTRSNTIETQINAATAVADVDSVDW